MRTADGFLSNEVEFSTRQATATTLPKCWCRLFKTRGFPSQVQRGDAPVIFRAKRNCMETLAPAPFFSIHNFAGTDLPSVIRMTHFQFPSCIRYRATGSKKKLETQPTPVWSTDALYGTQDSRQGLARLCHHGDNSRDVDLACANVFGRSDRRTFAAEVFRCWTMKPERATATTKLRPGNQVRTRLIESKICQGSFSETLSTPITSLAPAYPSSRMMTFDTSPRMRFQSVSETRNVFASNGR
jgi:hypothetical protein